MSTCPSGHDSASDDYCDVCGLPIPATPVEEVAQQPSRDAAPAEPDAGATACPNCQATNPPNALFCEACGYDFTTGSMPRPFTPPTIDSILDLGSGGSGPSGTPEAKPAAPADAPIAPPLEDGWVAEVWIDPDWYADQESTDPLPSAGVPTVVQLRTTSILVGRTSRSRGIHPDIDLVADNGISRRHCQLTTDGTRWWVEDLGSSNGTYLGTIGSLPKDPLPAGEKREIGPDGRVYLGAWTRLVVRRATPGEF
ncbi:MULTISPECIES: FHA domain-containing protein [unclassified Nocardioides]|uniref:FHA domain-containing protein n=1 Tax=unclassified Nocardioides TaxID=2615069 RepID=UPI0006FE8582|nr:MULTISPECIES: FHA domain-containing protein [unclassified Nocardioides]KRA29642.1 phosphopeptide-binding protein [Nocardioides sp. Root614]KRA88183.1 phosphopeptide-binding protein [Nocardioides sp. Root682]